jgi:hypothetical protein
VKAERLAADVIAAVQQHYGITKSAGATQMLMAAVLPLAEQIAKQDRHIKRTTKQLRKQHKRLRQIAGTDAARPFTHPARGMVPMKPGEWRLGLQPAAEPARNGHSFGPDDDDGPDSGPWDDLRN